MEIMFHKWARIILGGDGRKWSCLLARWCLLCVSQMLLFSRLCLSFCETPGAPRRSPGTCHPTYCQRSARPPGSGAWRLGNTADCFQTLTFYLLRKTGSALRHLWILRRGLISSHSPSSRRPDALTCRLPCFVKKAERIQPKSPSGRSLYSCLPLLACGHFATLCDPLRMPWRCGTQPSLPMSKMIFGLSPLDKRFEIAVGSLVDRCLLWAVCRILAREGEVSLNTEQPCPHPW